MPCQAHNLLEQSQGDWNEPQILILIYRSEQETLRNTKFSSRHHFSFGTCSMQLEKTARGLLYHRASDTSVLIYSPDVDPVPDDLSPSSKRVHLTPVHIILPTLYLIIFTTTTTTIIVIIISISIIITTTGAPAPTLFSLPVFAVVKLVIVAP